MDVARACADRHGIRVRTLGGVKRVAETTEREQQLKKLNEMIKDIKFAMLTTVEADGSLRSRPMATQEAEFDGDLWFFTGASASKVDEVEQEEHVNVTFSDNDKNRWVSMSGMARLVRDRNRIEEYWNPVYKAWFPRGLDDPDLALLKVDVDHAEYWDSSSGAVVHAVGFVKALAAGQRYEPGENEKLEL